MQIYQFYLCFVVVVMKNFNQILDLVSENHL